MEEEAMIKDYAVDNSTDTLMELLNCAKDKHDPELNKLIEQLKSSVEVGAVLKKSDHERLEPKKFKKADKNGDSDE